MFLPPWRSSDAAHSIIANTLLLHSMGSCAAAKDPIYDLDAASRRCKSSKVCWVGGGWWTYRGGRYT
jgi:hypothetical protein